jgi:hypothetical protein
MRQLLDSFMPVADQFTSALKVARSAEAAQLEALLSLQDARALRLENLRAAVQFKLPDKPEVRDLLELSTEPGAKPKLWVDLVSSVVMEPDPRTYRLVQHREGHIETLFQSTDMEEMAAYLVRYVAQRVVLRDKVAASQPASQSAGTKTYSVIDMIYVWLTGCVFGVMALLTVAMYMGMLHF